jgi:thiosulfate/3-mercaptopyruvate sulfurtransferase
MSYTTLITAEQLRDLRPAPVIVDTSFDLADANAGEASWREGHLPGSFYLHLDRDLSAVKTGSNGRHPLPDRNAFAITLARCGITPTTQVVVLDRQGGTFAPRLWWMLRWMGHAEVAMLDGGLAAWTAAGGALTAEATPAAPATPTYPERASLTRTTSATELQAALGRVTLLDARAGERFRGDVEPLDRAAGHIPGALNRFFKDNLDAATGRFKPGAQLRAEFTALIGAGGVADAVHQCGSGVTACHNLLAMEHAGLAGSALYPGSWSEWSSDPSRPVAQGA